jgi:hypothetical protein
MAGRLATLMITVVWIGASAATRADAAESAHRVTTLAIVLDQRQLGAIAAADPDEPGRFDAALYAPGAYVLAISAVHPDPARMKRMIAAGNYRQAYSDLHTLGVKDGRLFVEDLQANGLRPTRADDEPFDIVWENARTKTVYDGDWTGQALSKEEYEQRFARADRRYSDLLRVLITRALSAEPLGPIEDGQPNAQSTRD